MLVHRHRHLRIAWLALLVFTLATLVPTVARAMAFMQGQFAPWGQLCTTGDNNSHIAPDGLLADASRHCPVCHLLADPLAPATCGFAGQRWSAAPALASPATSPGPTTPAPGADGQARAPPAADRLPQP